MENLKDTRKKLQFLSAQIDQKNMLEQFLQTTEEEYIRRICNDGADIDISKGYIENGVLKIKSGFLKQLEHKIVRYSKRQHRATVEVTLHGVPHKVVCGVDID